MGFLLMLEFCFRQVEQAKKVRLPLLVNIIEIKKNALNIVCLCVGILAWHLSRVKKPFHHFCSLDKCNE